MSGKHLSEWYLEAFSVLRLNRLFSFNWSFPGDQRCSYRGPYSHRGCTGHCPGCSRLALLGGEKEEADWRDVPTQCWRTLWYQLHSSTRCPEVTKGGKTHLNFSVWTNSLQDICEGQQCDAAVHAERKPSAGFLTCTERFLQDTFKKRTWLFGSGRSWSFLLYERKEYFSNTVF